MAATVRVQLPEETSNITERQGFVAVFYHKKLIFVLIFSAVRTMKKRVFLSFLSLILLSLGWLGVSGVFLAFALVPLMMVSRSYDDSRRSLRTMALHAAAVTGIWALVTTWWIWYAAPIGTIAVVVAHILLFGGVFTLWHFISKRSSGTVSCIVLVCGWIAAEYWLMQGEISFPWLTLGNGLANDIWAVQWYEFTGTFGGSLWLLLCNVAFYEALTGRTKAKTVTAVAIFVVPMILSAAMFLHDDSAGEKVTVTVVQPNIDPYTEKFDGLSQDEQNTILLSLSQEAPQEADYIVWPETAVDDIIREHALLASGSIRRFDDFLSERYPETQLVFGASTYRYYEDGKQSETARRRGNMWVDIYNSALAMDSSDNVPIHHKNKLVVGAEKMPYLKLLRPFGNVIVELGGISGQLGTDDAVVVFRHANSRHPNGTAVSAAICYESLYGSYLARFVRGGSRLLFVITNDGWWHDTPGYRQHFSYSRLRAIELRRSVARSANTGISGFIDSKGRVIDSLGWDKRGTLTQNLTLNDKITFYASHGDYVARISVLLFFMGIFYHVAWRYRKRD